MWYIYKMPNGMADVTEYALTLDDFPGYVFIGTSEVKPDYSKKKFDENNVLVDDRIFPEYVENRKAEYPDITDQLDMFWHAMDDGVIPKIEPFYSDIKVVKEKYPKPTQI